MVRIDALYLEDPSNGSRRIVHYLAQEEIPISCDWVRNLMRRVIRESHRAAFARDPVALQALSVRVQLLKLPQDPASPARGADGRALRPFARRPTDGALIAHAQRFVRGGRPWQAGGLLAGVRIDALGRCPELGEIQRGFAWSVTDIGGGLAMLELVGRRRD
jgi:hypothetical protein